MSLVFKFGGASVKSPEAVRNAAAIVSQYGEKNLVIVVSAMGKTTNALEAIHRSALTGKADVADQSEALKTFHMDIVKALFPEIPKALILELKELFNGLAEAISSVRKGREDYAYDRLVPYGELLSTTIMSHYLRHQGLENRWMDARELVKTDYSYRQAKVDWLLTSTRIKQQVNAYFETGPGKIVVTQGFIGGADSLHATTLGREGSDYSAAIFAYALDAESVSIWKDVPGVLNADPRAFPNAQWLPKISYKEAIELAYYGASVIHPKTVQPLQNKKIPLYVKSFVDPDSPGTLISDDNSEDARTPAFIIKHNQRLISLATKDFSFIAEEHLSHIFRVFGEHGITMNMMQNSAINFSVSVDEDDLKLAGLVKELQQDYEVRYNQALDLLTIRHFNDEIVAELTKGRTRLLEQRTRNTLRLLLQ